MSTTVAGFYSRGSLRLLENPRGLREGPVMVTLIESNAPQSKQHPLQFGKYAGERMSTEEDFHIAEWRGEEEDADE